MHIFVHKVKRLSIENRNVNLMAQNEPSKNSNNSCYVNKMVLEFDFFTITDTYWIGLQKGKVNGYYGP